MTFKAMLVSLFLTILLVSPACSVAESDNLASGFADPPDSAKSWTFWWWLNGYVSKDGITRDLDAMHKRGISGALVFHAGIGYTPKSTEFMSSQWREFFRFAVEEAAKRNITIGFNVCGGWNAGGPWVKPDDAAKILVHSTTDLNGPQVFNDKLRKPGDATYRDVAVLAWPVSGPLAKGKGKKAVAKLSSAQVLDLTDKMDQQGRLKWSVPNGHWRVVRFGWQIPKRAHTKATGGKSYLEIDPFSAKAMDKHFAATAGVLIKDVGAHAGKTFKYLHIDSGEIGHPDWTPSLRADFKRLRGYDPFPYLAAKTGQVVDDPEITARFLEDYDRTIGDLMIECYYGRLDKLAKPHGLGTHCEAAGYQKPATDALGAMGSNDICMSEFWSRRSPTNPYIHQLTPDQLRYHDGIKNAASAAHVYGRRIVQAEAHTVTWHSVWSKYPFALKDIGDRAFCAGLNRHMLCFMVHQPENDSKPGYAFRRTGTNFDRHVTWWPMGKAWLTYLARCQHLLQSGRFVADVCYFQGEWSPAYVPAKWAMDPPLPPGSDCDTINADALIRRTAAGEDGRLVLSDGQSYRYLVLWQGGRWKRPPQEIFSRYSGDFSIKCPAAGSKKPLALSLATLRKLKELVEAGVTVVGPRPERAIGLTGYPNSDTQVKKLADALWGETSKAVGQRKVGKGRVIWGQTLAEVMRADGVGPDLEIRESPETKALAPDTLSGIPHPSSFSWIHRRIEGTDVYFIANLRNASAAGQFTFHTEGKQPELWDAVTGEMRDAVAFQQTDDGRTTVPLKLPPRGSIFVLFRKPIPASQDGSAATNWPTLSSAMEIKGPWTVRFDPEWGGPKSVVFEKLEDWTKRPEPGIKHYSGTATYQKTFDLPEALRQGKQRVYLNLGKVNNLAEVRINGKDLGVVWTAPWQVEITAALQPTGNKLEIDVVNLWRNRLIGDAALPEEKRLTKTNVTDVKANSPLLESGLLGPVTIQAEE